MNPFELNFSVKLMRNKFNFLKLLYDVKPGEFQIKNI